MSETKRVLFYFGSAELDDAQRALLATLDRLIAEQPETNFRVLVPRYECGVAAEIKARGLELDTLALPLWRGFSSLWSLVGYYKKLFRYFQMYDFTLVHADDAYASALSTALKIRFDVPLIWQFWAPLATRVRTLGYRWLVSVFCDHLIAANPTVAQELGRSPRWRGRISIAGDRQALESVYKKAA